MGRLSYLAWFTQVDMSSLMEMRNVYKDAFLEKHGVKLGFMSAFIKAAGYALSEVPAVNGGAAGCSALPKCCTSVLSPARSD
jgi:2-oxoglutarate dehydrogenase E2 component (dihydrolipoamide succinyltransferase)